MIAAWKSPADYARQFEDRAVPLFGYCDECHQERYLLPFSPGADSLILCVLCSWSRLVSAIFKQL